MPNKSIPKKTIPKRRYVSPSDRVQKLGLIGNMGYISANPDAFTYQYSRQLAWRWVSRS